MKETSVVLAGVGGQGALLSAEILGVAAVKEGLNVRVSEIHGMAQRGGAVTSHVRIGDAVFSPSVLDGQADVLVGFEPLETLRNIRYASAKTLVLMSNEKIPPPELAFKKASYPKLEEIMSKIQRFTKNVVVIDAGKLAKEAGNVLTKNIVLLGALAATGKVPIKKESIIEALKELVPPKHVEFNVKAFNLGYQHIKKGV
ncbi:MAG: indolepyruvate ferredoxin oxidoreductase subunit beta [Candidatus Bathyarchaeia archaeon]